MRGATHSARLSKKMEGNFADGFYTLTDEEGNESDFELIGQIEVDGVTYMALVPVDNDEEYVIFRVEEDESGEEILVTIEDDDEFEKVAAIFDEELFEDVDYDEDEDEEDQEDEE